jgi:hypothetical protein
LRKSRSVLISGGDEPVEGGREKHSSFAYQLINVLRTMKGDYGTGGEIFEQVQQGLVASGGRQQPAFGKIEGTGDEGGEFIFIRNHNESGYRSPGR